MNRMLFVVFAVVLQAAGSVGCTVEKPTPVAGIDEQAEVLAVPAADDDAGWKLYLQQVVEQNLGDIANSPFLYYLPPQNDPDFQSKYESQTAAVKGVLERGIQRDNLLAFGSPASTKMAELIETAFAEVHENSLEGVHILFIGESADNERVRLAVAPSGVEYRFVEVK